MRRLATPPLAAAVLALVLLAARGAGAQDQEALRRHFEGKSVRVKMDMPGTSQGVDVYPLRDRPIDYHKLAERLKENGVGVANGQQMMVTKIVVKKEHIEFQLGGGGFGTMGDFASMPSSVAPTVAKSKRERDLEKRRKGTTDEKERDRIDRELEGLRRDRIAEERRRDAEHEREQREQASQVLERRAAGGSRFNIRFEQPVPARFLAPEGVMAALGEFVDFSGAAAPVVATGGVAPPAAGAALAPSGGAVALRKGMSVADVEALLGTPASTVTKDAGAIAVETRTYRSGDVTHEVDFVNGVVVAFRSQSG